MPETIITRQSAYALIDEQISREIIQGAIAQSAVLSLGHRLSNMTSDRTSMPVLDMLPLAYFVNGETGRKNYTKMAWDKKFIHAEEIAVIVPVPEAVIDDSSYDIWGEIRPRVQEAFGAVMDDAILFGVNKPASWRADLVSSIRNYGKNVTPTSDLAMDIIGENGVIAKVEESGFEPNGVIAGINIRGKLRGLKNASGDFIFKPTLQGKTEYALDGMPIHTIKNGTWDPKTCQMIVGDMSQLVYSIRQDLTYKVLDQAVIQDPSTGEILYNLAQQDMVAIRFVMRMGWEVPNPINLQGGSTRFPFALLDPSSAPTMQTVTFTVTDSGSGNVEGAKVTFGGNEKLTNESGKAEFKALAGSYMYSVKMAGAKTRTGETKVDSSPVSVTISNFRPAVE